MKPARIIEVFEEAERILKANKKKKKCGCKRTECCSVCTPDITDIIKKVVITSSETKKR